ncbi:magnesium chelatase subunit of protochlorophyllide reductase, chloroplastic [Raphidocelis subcapitata]|uniref:Mg-protoporphyrin IX chelatase n=1 Tax=Raphidocelis subcapitata TaxID=307507 RepID=A0A2V0NP12_9CHLO|nr:magnesium chelatase subunit of protochlorophyllide reductase, chloroplastic [Raphidocelis subcapitata]|eukprot:GBF89326.1 magnesium chelatase subunit of protochlorophyllide reductase, chloroplastic [Raphidocelis subcapitata]
MAASTSMRAPSMACSSSSRALSARPVAAGRLGRVAMRAMPQRAAVAPFQGCKPALRGACKVSAVAAVAENLAAAKAAIDSQARPIFPFTAIVGQEEMKLALILNVIDPKIGGVMIMGDRGTGKSTTIRALADLLPEIKVVDKDPFNSDPDDPELMSEEVRNRIKAGEQVPVGSMKIPMVDLPLGATEDRVCGTIDIEKALTEGVKAFEPGLLAKANRGILYVDEVNLLDDHLVDVLLDSAASGWNTVEREGISISHPARFILVGSGNPEEGELRPQLLDRFGMHAQIGTVKDPELRVQIVAERSTFDEDPATFRTKYEDRQLALTQKIVEARQRLKGVQIPYDFRVKISQICSELNVDGIRGDIVTNRAAKAIAAFEGRTDIAVEDIYRVIPLCLRHRLRKDPLADIDSGDKVREVFKVVFGME